MVGVGVAKLLLVDDSPDLLASLTEFLSQDSYSVESCNSGEEALELLAYSKYDLIILDITMPGIDGFGVCRQFRADGGHTPILFLTGKNSVYDKESGFDLGGDDYLTKPFSLIELSARIRALLRRYPSIDVGLLRFSDLVVDSKTRIVKRANSIVKLSHKEYELLEFLLRHPTEVFNAADLLQHVWPSESTSTVQTVRACVKRLRESLDVPGKPTYIDNQRGHGYMLNQLFVKAEKN
jgi:DNA-binding response OmpR family regulator